MAGEKWVFNHYYANIQIADDGAEYVFQRYAYTELSSAQYSALTANDIFAGKVTDGLFEVVDEEPTPPAPVAVLTCVYPLSVTENGTYTGSEGVAYSPVTVSVSPAVVATPAATPKAGEVTSGDTVALATTTADATIFYTTDGSAPSLASTRYTAAISIVADTTIKAIAVKSGCTDSEVLEAAYTVTG